ncbi:hypothetical protein HWD35_14150 [Tsukamurella tyrosinosolvens]|uniref:hypothetical protein n=2 Tax=Tsukamurella tyrosinosolvens TaxID=57704 RepID=UPI000791F554|nr:hypothetical protein [Tsukamurella tyrosinosolvens]AUN40978.1 hypothetical protein ASU32_13965 [Tsukamurella tyrosinosolvens]KXP04312.1 hypothetical protein AXK59_12755 [Tsukamurella tyrosinosolvens]KZL97551.1 hypothetical protein AXX05_00875 [Tsukamurella tyrosinosolvens]MCA4995857.1 hypothetical protein [Tsukamurella tyrosinosolvens]RDB49078.1 hypothetical protein DVB87_04660 [Tsukamurella tyrosinosolvens]
MTDCVISPATAAAHESALTTIATTVSAAGTTSSSNRVGDGDYGALFGWLATRVNDALDDLTESVSRHSGELETHRTEFRRNITVNQQTDQGGATALTETGRR